MPKVSINILTKNRAELLTKALNSVLNQTYQDFEIVAVNDGSTDGTNEVLKDSKFKDLKIITHLTSVGITNSRKEALEKSQGEYVAILDDDDEWLDINKLKKQVEFLDKHKDYVLAGGGIKVEVRSMNYEVRVRPETDSSIRKWMLLKNPFFTSTVMFRREAALKAGGFVKDNIDLGEDYDLWLRLGKLGKMYNFQEVFVNYAKPQYNKLKFLQFLQKQLRLVEREKRTYPFYFFARLALRIRLKLYDIFF